MPNHVPAAATGLPVATIKTADPIMPFYSEWRAASRELDRLAGMPGSRGADSPEYLAAEVRMYDAQAKIADRIPTSLEGIATQAHVLWSIIGPDSPAGTPASAGGGKMDDAKLITGIWLAASKPWPVQV